MCLDESDRVAKLSVFLLLRKVGSLCCCQYNCTGKQSETTRAKGEVKRHQGCGQIIVEWPGHSLLGLRDIWCSLCADGKGASGQRDVRRQSNVSPLPPFELKCGGWRDESAVKSNATLAEDPVSVASTHRASRNPW